MEEMEDSGDFGSRHNRRDPQQKGIFWSERGVWRMDSPARGCRAVRDSDTGDGDDAASEHDRFIPPHSCYTTPP